MLPFLAFNCIMGWVIYVQHTHPDVAWFDKRDEWQKRLGFITTTINVVVPKSMGRILHDILEHGAHHVNTGVPLYRLRAAQTALKNAVPQLARVLRAELEALLGHGSHLQAVRLREPSLARLQGSRNRGAAVPRGGVRGRLIGHRRPPPPVDR